MYGLEPDVMLKLYALYVFFDSDCTQRVTINAGKWIWGII